MDPGQHDSGYWLRFQSRVLYLAAPELARRRAAGDLTIGDVLLSWGRLLVPATVMAAAVAAMILLPSTGRGVASDLAIEEALVTGLDDGPMPAILSSDLVDESALRTALEGP